MSCSLLLVVTGSALVADREGVDPELVGLLLSSNGLQSRADGAV